MLRKLPKKKFHKALKMNSTINHDFDQGINNYALDYVALIKKDLAKAENPEYALQMSAYMKDLFPFLGIKKPLRGIISKPFFQKYGLPDQEALKEVIRLLFDLDEREFQYLAIDLFARKIKSITKEDISFIEWMIVNKSWWDSVDIIASKFAGAYFLKHPDQMLSVTEEWNQSDNMWLRRSSIIFQLSYKEKTDSDMLFTYCLNCKNEKEFFIQKAIGWALRQYARTDADKVKKFVGKHDFAPLSKREALKHFKNS